METTLAANAELIEGIFFGFFFAVLYFAPKVIRNLSGNVAPIEGVVYTNENGSACYCRRNYKF